MRDGDPHDLVEGGKMAMMIVDRCVPLLWTSPRLLIMVMSSAGQAPWLMDILWHLPAGKGLHRMQHVATEMMRTRIKADKNVEMRDLASYLVSVHRKACFLLPNMLPPTRSRVIPRQERRSLCQILK
jgi:hypothetical protein